MVDQQYMQIIPATAENPTSHTWVNLVVKVLTGRLLSMLTSTTASAWCDCKCKVKQTGMTTGMTYKFTASHTQKCCLQQQSHKALSLREDLSSLRTWLHSLQRIWDSCIQVGICLVPGGFGRNPAHGLGDPPHMSVHWKLVPVKAEHEHTCNGLLANTLESFQLSLNLFICA